MKELQEKSIEKFMAIIPLDDVDFVERVATACHKICLESQIELLKTMYASYSHSEPRHDYNKGYFDCQRNTDKFIDKRIAELQNELKNLK